MCQGFHDWNTSDTMNGVCALSFSVNYTKLRQLTNAYFHGWCRVFPNCTATSAVKPMFVAPLRFNPPPKLAAHKQHDDGYAHHLNVVRRRYQVPGTNKRMDTNDILRKPSQIIDIISVSTRFTSLSPNKAITP